MALRRKTSSKAEFIAARDEERCCEIREIKSSRLTRTFLRYAVRWLSEPIENTCPIIRSYMEAACSIKGMASVTKLVAMHSAAMLFRLVAKSG